MGDHLVLDVDRLVKPEIFSGLDERRSLPPEMLVVGKSSSASSSAVGALDERMDEANDEEAPLMTTAECRICQDEDDISNMESPCACSGSLKYAHRKCVQHWCNEKGDITCEICHQSYQPDYTAPHRPRLEEATIDIGGGWHISGTPLDLRDPRILAITEAERQILEAEYDEYTSTNASGASFFRSAALILMALLLLRHAVTVTDADEDGDASNFFTEAAALAATHFAFVLQSRTPMGLHITLASSPTVTTQHHEQYT